MKKLLLYLLSFLLLSTFSIIKTKSSAIYVFNNIPFVLTNEEKNFLIENHITYDDISPYLQYSSFNVYKYYDYENIRLENNYSYLETVNYMKYPNYFNEYISPNNSLFKNSNLILTNKSFYLNSYYVPSNLKPISSYNIHYIQRENEVMKSKSIVLDNYQKMYNEAQKNNIELVIYSAYRSYHKQSELFYKVNNQNDRYSAKPGFSEHQTGLSLDISDTTHGLTLNLQYANTFYWLNNNCYKYGFILRYPKGKEFFTKYNYEPWHYRYVGIEHSKIIHENNLTLEEYLFSYFEL